MHPKVVLAFLIKPISDSLVGVLSQFTLENPTVTRDLSINLLKASRSITGSSSKCLELVMLKTLSVYQRSGHHVVVQNGIAKCKLDLHLQC